jgi:hypothetical protein
MNKRKDFFKKIGSSLLIITLFVGTFFAGGKVLNGFEEQAYGAIHGSDFGTITDINQSITKMAGNYTFTSQLDRAIYEFELIGDPGGSVGTNNGGAAGRLTGNLVLNAGESIYITLDTGGGIGKWCRSYYNSWEYYNYGGEGGGMSAITIGSPTINAQNVIAIAGGGGGAGEASYTSNSSYGQNGGIIAKGGSGGSYIHVKQLSGSIIGVGAKSNGQAGATATYKSPSYNRTGVGGAAGAGAKTLLATSGDEYAGRFFSPLAPTPSGGGGAGYYGGEAGGLGRTDGYDPKYCSGGGGGGGGGSGYVDLQYIRDYGYSSTTSAAKLTLKLVGFEQNILPAIAPPSIQVGFGTSLDDVMEQLGSEFELEGNYGKETIHVEWTCPNYDMYTVGTYTFTGTITDLDPSCTYTGTLPLKGYVSVADTQTGEYVTKITVLQGIPFDLVIPGYDDLPDGAVYSGIKVTNPNNKDKYINISGTISTLGIKGINMDGYYFIFDVIEEPTSSNITVLLN